MIPSVTLMPNQSIFRSAEEIEIICSPQNGGGVPDPILLGLSITPPEQTVYEIGEELDLTGLKVYKCYSDGTYTEITDYQVQGFDSTVVGRQEIQIISGENTNTFSVEVHEEGTLIKDINIPERLTVTTGVEKLLKVVYTPDTIYDSEFIITSSDESVVHTRDSYLIEKTPGTATVTVTDKYGRIKRACEVTVLDAVAGDINMDGKMDLLDLMMCLHHVPGSEMLGGYARADVI